MLATTPSTSVTETFTTRVVGGLRILVVGERVLVASRSEEGRWYDVTEGACGCKGYEHRGRCAHLTATAELFKPAEPIPFTLTAAALALIRPTALPPLPTTIQRVPMVFSALALAADSELYPDEPLGAA